MLYGSECLQRNVNKFQFQLMAFIRDKFNGSNTIKFAVYMQFTPTGDGPYIGGSRSIGTFRSSSLLTINVMANETSVTVAG